MPSNNPSLQSLRSKVNDCQRAILDDVWAHVKEKNVGLPERPLLERYGKASLAAETSKLGGTIIHSSHEENKLRYNLGIFGVCLTYDRPHLWKLVELSTIVPLYLYRN